MGGNPRVAVYRVCRSALAVTVTVLVVAGWTVSAFALDPSRDLRQYCVRNWRHQLPQSTVHTILQTADGYLWLGTYEGLVRFDGARLRVLDSVRTGDLRGKAVFHLHEDELGRLWIGTNGGLTVMEGGAFTTLTAADGLPGDVVTVTQSDGEGGLWIGGVGRGRYSR